MAAGIIDLQEGTEIFPGETVTVVITFFPFDALLPELKPGREWQVQEGAKLIAYGKILEIL